MVCLPYSHELRMILKEFLQKIFRQSHLVALLKLSDTFKVTFSAPLTERQVVNLDIKNDWNKAIIFKMKTTRPEAFKMKPVYGLVDAGEKVYQFLQNNATFNKTK